MFAVIRLINKADLNKDIKDTLKMLNLDAPNNCVIVPKTADYTGMLKKLNNCVAYGEVDKQTLSKLLEKRLKLSQGDKKVDVNLLKESTGMNSFDELADSIIQGKNRLNDFKKLQKTLRLSPPSKGFKSTKSYYPEGDLGYQGDKIKDLLERMI